MASRLFAYKIVKEPPGAWEIDVRSPIEWAGRFRSQDGVAWWSPALDRPLGEHHSNPGEDRVLRGLQAVARGHELTQLRAVADAARKLLAIRESGSLSEVSLATDELAELLRELDGAHPQVSDEAALVVTRPGIAETGGFHPVSPQYVGDGHPDLRRARYERTEETEEP